MARKMKHKLAVGAGAALAVAGGGAALAATAALAESREPGSRRRRREATRRRSDEAERRAQAGAREPRRRRRRRGHADEGAGRRAEGTDRLRRVPALRRGRGFGHDHHGPKGFFGGHLAAAATYLGVTEAALRTSLEGGKTLADVAKEKGKTVAGLVDALVADETKELDAAVAAGKLTKAQRDEISRARSSVSRTSSRTGSAAGKGFRGHHFRGGPPPNDDSAFRFDEGPASVPPPAA